MKLEDRTLGLCTNNSILCKQVQWCKHECKSTYFCFMSTLIIVILTTFIVPAMCIHCYHGTSEMADKKDIADCSTLGLQREELYCRNISVFTWANGERVLLSVNRSCVASSWYQSGFALKMGCTEPEQITDLNGIEERNLERRQCTCSEDLCNAPPGKDGESHDIPNSAQSAFIITPFNARDYIILLSIHRFAFHI